MAASSCHRSSSAGFAGHPLEDLPGPAGPNRRGRHFRWRQRHRPASGKLVMIGLATPTVDPSTGEELGGQWRCAGEWCRVLPRGGASDSWYRQPVRGRREPWGVARQPWIAGSRIPQRGTCIERRHPAQHRCHCGRVHSGEDPRPSPTSPSVQSLSGISVAASRGSHGRPGHVDSAGRACPMSGWPDVPEYRS